MKKLSLITGLLFSCLMHSQNPTFQWVKSMGGATTESEIHSTIDVFSNVYITGSFQGTVDFDPGSGVYNLTAGGNKDIFIQKLNANGELVWAKRMGGGYEDIGTSITTDYSGNVIVTGNYKGIVDFNPNSGFTYLASEGSSDIFIQKLSQEGDLIWVKSIGSTTSDYGGSVKADEFGNIFLVHSFSGTVDFDPGRLIFQLTSNGGLDICIEKLDLTGDFKWAKSFGGSLDDVGKSISLDHSSNVYVTGYYQSTVDFDPGNGVSSKSSNGAEDIFVQKLSSEGNFKWATCMGGSSNDKGSSIYVDLEGNVYSTGSFEGTINYFDSDTGPATLISSGGSDVYVQKIAADGSINWIQSFGGFGNEYGTSVLVDLSNKVYISGGAHEPEVYNPNPEQKTTTIPTDENVFIQGLTTSGSFVSSIDIQSSSKITLSSLVSDNLGNLFLIGKYKGTVDFDPGEDHQYMTSNAAGAMYVLKLGQSITKVKETEIDNDQLSVYPNPAKDKLTIKLGNRLDNVKVELYDLIGNLVYSENSTNTKEININLNQPYGVYFINIEYNDKRVIKRLIVE